MILINSLGMSHEYAKKVVKQGDTVVDATCGKGRDTLLLAELAGQSGRVFAFDIQKKSIDMTAELLSSNNIINTTVLCESHEYIADFVTENVSCVMFNLGYLPGGDHSFHTKSESTLSALRQAMDLLKAGGIITIVIYQGGDTGFEEMDNVLEFCKHINQKSFTVMKSHFTNQKNNPPLFICIEKLQ